MCKITFDAAEKMRQKMADKEAKEKEKQHELEKATAVEHLRREIGKHQKPAPDSVQQRLQKACRRHLNLAGGMQSAHLNPRTCDAFCNSAENRKPIEDQLATRTTLSPAQRKSALHVFGPKVSSPGRGLAFTR